MSCGCGSKNRATRRQTMIRVETVYWTVVAAGLTESRHDTEDEAIAARNDLGRGQVRRRVEYQDVPSMYEVRLGDDIVGVSLRAAHVSSIVDAHPGAKVHMVPAPLTTDGKIDLHSPRLATLLPA